MLDYGKKSPEIDAEFYREFLRSDIITLGRPAPGSTVKEGYQLLESDTKFTLRLLEYRGEPVVAIYSSFKRLTDVIPEQYYSETGYIKLSCKTLLEMVRSWGRQDKLALNPGHMIVKTFSPDEVQALLDGRIFKQLDAARIARSAPRPQFFPKGTHFSVSRPKVVPTALMDKLAVYFESTKDVGQAFLGEIDMQSSRQPAHLVICVRLSDNSKRTFNEVSDDLGPTIRSVLGGQEIIDILDLKLWPGIPISQLIRCFPK